MKIPVEMTYKSEEYTRGKMARQEGKSRKDEESMKPKTKCINLVLWKQEQD